MEDRYKLRSEEQDDMYRMSAATTALLTLNSRTENRLKKIGAWSLYRGGLGMIAKAYRKIYSTVPLGQLMTIERNIDHARFEVKIGKFHVGSHTPSDDDGIWLDNNQINTLIMAARESCILCTKDPQNQRSCKLRDVFEDMPIHASEESMNTSFDECPYSALKPPESWNRDDYDRIDYGNG